MCHFIPIYLLTSHKSYCILGILRFTVVHIIVKHHQNHHCMVGAISNKLILILMSHQGKYETANFNIFRKVIYYGDHITVAIYFNRHTFNIYTDLFPYIWVTGIGCKTLLALHGLKCITA